MSLDSTLTATPDLKLPDPARAGFADKLYRLDGGHSLANDEFDLDARRECGAEHRIFIDVLADRAGKPMAALGYGRSRIRVE